MDERKDPYERTFKDIVEYINQVVDMVLWIAKRTLTVKDYTEFYEEFSEKERKTPSDELIGMLKEDKKEG